MDDPHHQIHILNGSLARNRFTLSRGQNEWRQQMNTTETNPEKASQPGGQPPPPEQKPLSRWLFIGLGIAAVLLAVVIYTGIHQRAEAENNLGRVTERAAVPTVTVVQPKSNAAAQEIVLPGNTQAFR